MALSKFGLILVLVYFLILLPQIMGTIKTGGGNRFGAEGNLLKLTLPGSLAVAIPGGPGAVNPRLKTLVYLLSFVLNAVIIYFLGYFLSMPRFWPHPSIIKFPFYVYLCLGLIFSWLSMLFLPRSRFLDRFASGLGLYLPVFLLFLCVGGIIYYFDPDNPQNKFFKLGLMAVTEAGLIFYFISTIKVGF